MYAIRSYYASVGISNSVSKPIQKLCQTTELVAKGDFNTRAEDSSGNEISMLNSSFNSMIGQIGNLIEHIKETSYEKSTLN